MSAPVGMVVDVTQAMIKHGVKVIRQDHMNRLLVLLGEMLAAQEGVTNGR